MFFLIAALIALWAYCGYLAAGYAYATFQSIGTYRFARAHRVADTLAALTLWCLGPIGLVAMQPYTAQGRLYWWEQK
ncbi:hypothetical protein [Kineobactrum salinum]|uniref:Uncharacterized protein n=1 Tax=Kineobactrum salinum TaxID=2708301 RepID=A0A6C0U4R2_9GAMM|nr:hypothetical protein [Kineobactrum salinum]QIB67140.1 hypothetical protein G3T16_18780 [Kineobactrum salinum]